ncbi:MAG: hypothetical protein K1X88_31950 [Nannocystaceae bacterium]|nr:hypothetical protein [Nannocystaceae bacterium]
MLTDDVAIVVEADDDVGARIDVVLGRRVAGLSRRVARAVALAGGVTRNGARARPSDRAARGDRLELRRHSTLPPASLDVLTVTERFVYVAKPAGTHTHRLRPDEPGALADAVARAFPECADASAVPREGGAIHRLDRETTGVVAFARTPGAWLEGRRAIRHPGALKLYVALCHAPDDPRWPPQLPGVQPHEPAALPLPPQLPVPTQPQTVIVSLPLGRGGSRREVAVRPGGHPAQSLVTPLAGGPTHWLVALHLRQGHRHQARVHLAALGLPIDGDGRYGGGEGALALHAVVLDLGAACSGEPRVVCPLPAVLAERLDALALHTRGA